jgi:hypothetical protein
MDQSNLALKYAKKIQYHPGKPEQPSGTRYGNTGRNYTYTTASIDFDQDRIQYGWDWGDDTPTEWTEFCEQGEKTESVHVWEKKGSYEIKVIAKDENGLRSEWSDPLAVTMPKNHQPNNLSLSSKLKIFSWLLYLGQNKYVLL